MQVEQNKVDIIVVTYNAAQWVSYFAPAFTTLPEGWRVVVVDNASQDNTLALLREQYPHFCLIASPTNLGFGGANNLALRKALQNNCDYVFLLNQDAQISVEDIQKIIAVQKNNPEYQVVSPVHLNGEKTFFDKGYASYVQQGEAGHIAFDTLMNRPLQQVYSVPFVNAAAWLLTSTCLRTVGGFDPLFFHYGEDSNYLDRVAHCQYKIGIVPSAFACHNREFRTSERENSLSLVGQYLAMVARTPENTLRYGVKGSIRLLLSCVKHLLRGNIPAATARWDAFCIFLRQLRVPRAYRAMEIQLQEEPPRNK
ncbi:glycosyltransferase [Desulfovibrio cuneatus]|uniref:glycosyltransferase n=1 Tax=Desulfovibrio cuneatus TaxID=159728 RepID=UPI00041EC2CE|nr:glycosyltransferase [Desulfovibrio cuneatus]